MNIVLGVFIGLLCLMFLIVSHEFGHFLAARKSGVRVKEFGIGFPPRAVAWLHVPPKQKNDKWRWKKLKKSDWKKDQASLVLSLNFLPIGGFCAMDGESDDDDRKGTFGSVSYWKKTFILFAGVAMNWLVAFVILTVLAWTGLPKILDNQFTISSDEKTVVLEPVSVDSVLENSPAEIAGFRSGDIITSVSFVPDSDACSEPTHESLTPYGDTCLPDSHEVLSASDITSFNDFHAGETVIYHIRRTNATLIEECDCVTAPCNCPTESFEKTLELVATLNPRGSDYLLGITMTHGDSVSRYTWSAPLVGAGLTVQMTGETFRGLWGMVKNLVTGATRSISTDAETRAEGREQVSEATAGVSGIVGILGGYFPSIVSSGPTYVFLLSAIISISLACMNVLPIPALDGGRWLMITLARLKRKKLSKATEQKIVARAFVFLLILMALITILDIIRLF
ncbi:site-2 protease family protein [Candidatus Saccharibacteria bacterium]|nr:site-2 protease family protein [Candidatus Saccharibacteria bacterium]